MSTLTDEILRRRTFAIISHPDAGKTTLTEKLLLFGGAIQLAGEVKARGERRRVRSDWMAVERERGISVSSAVMSFEHRGARLQPARHAGPPGFQRGHLPHPDRGRQRGDGARRRQGHRGADPQALRGLPIARRADHHLCQQARPRGPRPVRPVGRDRAVAGARRDPGLLADRHGARLSRHLRPLRRCALVVRARRPRPGHRAGPLQRPRRPETARGYCRKKRSPNCARRSRWRRGCARHSTRRPIARAI